MSSPDVVFPWKLESYLGAFDAVLAVPSRFLSANHVIVVIGIVAANVLAQRGNVRFVGQLGATGQPTLDARRTGKLSAVIDAKNAPA